VHIDPATNTAATPDCEITGNGRVRSFVIAAREDLEITRAVRSTLPERAPLLSVVLPRKVGVPAGWQRRSWQSRWEA